jgi:hypothetical protein
MPQELVIAVSSSVPFSENYLSELKAKAEEVAKKVSPLQVVVFTNDGDSSSHCLNTICHNFLCLPNAAWLWLIKDDLQWQPEDLVELLKTKRPIIGCLHTACEEWPHWQVTFYDDKLADEHGIIQVPEISANGLLIHRSVFEKILENPNFPLEFRDEKSWEPNYAFFQQARVGFRNEIKRLLKEEHFFQWMCRESGIGIYCHSKVRLKRKGPNGVIYPKEGQTPNLIAVPAPNAAEWPYKPISGKILIALQYWEGDKAQALKLAEFIGQTSSGDYLLAMFEGEAGLKYPDGPNLLAYRIFKEAVGYTDIKCVLLIEADCIPVSKDWINQLSEEWDRAAGQGKMVLGHWQKESGGHINGNLMFDPRLAALINLGDSPPKRPWDIAYPPIFEPVWARTGLIKNLYRRTNVTDEEMRTPSVGTKPPVLIHGVRDNGAWDYAKRVML